MTTEPGQSNVSVRLRSTKEPRVKRRRSRRWGRPVLVALVLTISQTHAIIGAAEQAATAATPLIVASTSVANGVAAVLQAVADMITVVTPIVVTVLYAVLAGVIPRL